MFPTIRLTLERWKYNEKYEVYVSTEGNIRDSLRRPVRILINEHGYCVCQIREYTLLVHRLVLSTWCPIANEGNFTVDHLDHNKRNNCMHNLEWTLKEENFRRARGDILVSPSKPQNLPEPRNTGNQPSSICINGVPMPISDAIQLFREENQDRAANKIAMTLEDLRPRKYQGFVIATN